MASGLGDLREPANEFPDIAVDRSPFCFRGNIYVTWHEAGTWTTKIAAGPVRAEPADAANHNPGGAEPFLLGETSPARCRPRLPRGALDEVRTLLPHHVHLPAAPEAVARPLFLILLWRFQTSRRTLHLQDRRDRSCKYELHSCIETPVHPYQARIPSCCSAKGLKATDGPAAFNKLVSHRRRDYMWIEPREERPPAATITMYPGSHRSKKDGSFPIR